MSSDDPKPSILQIGLCIFTLSPPVLLLVHTVVSAIL